MPRYEMAWEYFRQTLFGLPLLSVIYSFGDVWDIVNK